MSLFKKMRDSLTSRLAPKAGEYAARAAANQAKKKLDGMGKKIEEALFGDDEEKDERSVEQRERDEKEAAALETRKKLEAAQRRVDERRAREAEERKKAAAVEDELAAMKKRLSKGG